MFCIIGVANIARKREDRWQIRINGRRTIESTIAIHNEGDEILLEESDIDTTPIKLEQDYIGEFVEVFEWIYSDRTTDRMTVFRNIVTLYSTTIASAIKEIDEIAESSKSNFRFYISDSIEEFVGVQQDVSNYIFETHREMADIRRSLANNLSQDLFRVFAFTAIIWVGIAIQLTEITTIQLALGLSLIPVIIYLGLGLRATYSLSKQFQSIEEGRQQYYSMYENRIEENVLREIKKADGGDDMKQQFKTDLFIYYITFGVLILISTFTAVDLLWLDWIFTDIIEAST